MTVTADTHTLEQRMTALEKANDIRLKRAQLKSDIREGTVDAVTVISDPPVWANTMRVSAVIESVRGIGDAKVGRILERCHVQSSATLASLTTRQRCCLAPLVGRQRAGVSANTGGPWRPAMSIANVTRIDRGKLRLEVASLSAEAGLERLAVLIGGPPACLASLKVVDLLSWAHRVGTVSALRFMRAARVTSMRTVGQLTPRQRDALAACLRGDTAAVREEAEIREWAARVAA